MPKPIRASIRMYQVGFGDCFLVSFHYDASLADGRQERHILIDYGSTRRPASGPKMDVVASSIAQHCGERLDVIVVTHRHKDHLSGFSLNEPAQVLGGLDPQLVVRSWTEDPDIAETAQEPEALRFVAGLTGGQRFAGELSALAGESGAGRRRALAQLAFDQLSNEEAVTQLARWSENGRGEYLRYGDRSRIEDHVPGVRVRVLGPPTPVQHPKVQHQDENDPEYWLYRHGFLRTALAPALRPADAAVQAPEGEEVGQIGPVRWLIERMRDQQIGSLRRIVRWLDDALNNTSLILLFEAGSKRLLFPGDAQIENWEYALKHAPDKDDVLRLLGMVDLYKVGHHGSRNATPKTLYDLWNQQATKDRPITTLLSTRCGVHGETEATRVPRSELVRKLRERTSLHSTTGLRADELFVEVAADLTADTPFELVTPPPNPLDTICGSIPQT
jgi:hypothetical protein